jgi:hypothetical protein
VLRSRRTDSTAASGESAGSTPSTSQVPMPTTRFPAFSAKAISYSVP